MMSNKLFERLQVIKYLSFGLCFLVSFVLCDKLQGGFKTDFGQTANIVLSFDVSGSAVVSPYIQLPDGKSIYTTPALLTDVTDYVFYDKEGGGGSTFSIQDPLIGIYSIGALVHAYEDSVVNLNTKSTKFSTSFLEIFIRPTITNLYSLTMSASEFSLISVSMIYTALEETPP